MKKSKEFENILEECLERLLVGNETIEQCLQRFPELADELKPLLETALNVNEASAIQPSPEFRERARYQFQVALRETEAKRSRPFFSWRRRWVTVMAGVLALVLAGGGTVTAASGSMPDDFLYPVKLTTERVRLVFTPSALGKAEYYAELADKRVLEITRMADENKPEHVERTARRLNAYLTKIADLASTRKVTGGIAMVPAPREARAFEEEPEAAVEKAAQIKEAEPETAVAEEPAAAPRAPERARGGPERGIKPDRRAKLRALMERYASNHPARLRALLEKVPPPARAALLRAIAISESGYQKALKSLE